MAKLCALPQPNASAIAQTPDASDSHAPLDPTGRIPACPPRIRTFASPVPLDIGSALIALSRSLSVGGTFGGLLAAAVLQVPGIQYAGSAGPARGHHALVVRDEPAIRAVVTVAAAVLRAPGPIDLGGHRTAIERGESSDCEQGKSGAQHDEPPKFVPHPN